MQITALLTGRGGSTLKDKNILPVLGRPLLYYPAAAARNAQHITRWFVSSDDAKILDAAHQLGYEIIERPPELARPDAQHVDAILHALKMMTELNHRPDVLVVLLANNATVKSEWLDACIRILLDNLSLSSVVPVYKDMDHHPYRAKKMNADGLLEPYFEFGERGVSTNRQDLPANFFLCHNFWVLNVQQSIYSHNGQQPWTFLGNRIAPFAVEESIDVHDADDVQRIESWLRRNGIVAARA